MSPRTTINRLERVSDMSGRTLHFMIRGADRRHGPQFLSPSEVPPFEGAVAYFEMRRVRGPVWMTWKIIRQVEAPTRTRR